MRKTITTTRIYCVRCSGEVTGPVRGTGRVKIHSGHVDPKADTTCGTWGFRRERQSDRDT